MVGYVVAAWAVDLDVANGILPGYIMGLYFFTGYALRLQASHQSSQSSSSLHRLRRLLQHVQQTAQVLLPASPFSACICCDASHCCVLTAAEALLVPRRTCPNGLGGSTILTSCTSPGLHSC